MAQSPTRLTQKQDFEFMGYLKAEYANSGLNDANFAEQVTKTLGFFVNKDHVKSRRAALEIPNNLRIVRPVEADKDLEALWKSLGEAHEAIMDLRQQMADFREAARLSSTGARVKIERDYANGRG